MVLFFTMMKQRIINKKKRVESTFCSIWRPWRCSASKTLNTILVPCKHSMICPSSCINKKCFVRSAFPHSIRVICRPLPHRLPQVSFYYSIRLNAHVTRNWRPKKNPKQLETSLLCVFSALCSHWTLYKLEIRSVGPFLTYHGVHEQI